MVDVVLRPPDHGAWCDALPASRTLSPVLPEKVFTTENLIVLHKALVAQRLGADSAGEALGVPGLVHHLEDESVKDHPAAGSTFGYRC